MLVNKVIILVWVRVGVKAGIRFLRFITKCLHVQNARQAFSFFFY